jgi:hypothetical protein
MFKSLVVGGSLVFVLSQGALAQDGAMKTCGEKWQAAKASGATQGATWPKFLAECRAGLSASAPAAGEKPSANPSSKPVSQPPAIGVKNIATLVFPAAVAGKFADLRPGQARQKTCSEQFQANKATGGNGGLRWQEKGGGYWSQCNKKLKGA